MSNQSCLPLKKRKIYTACVEAPQVIKAPKLAAKRPVKTNSLISSWSPTVYVVPTSTTSTLTTGSVCGSYIGNFGNWQNICKESKVFNHMTGLYERDYTKDRKVSPYFELIEEDDDLNVLARAVYAALPESFWESLNEEDQRKQEKKDNVEEEKKYEVAPAPGDFFMSHRYH